HRRQAHRRRERRQLFRAGAGDAEIHRGIGDHARRGGRAARGRGPSYQWLRRARAARDHPRRRCRAFRCARAGPFAGRWLGQLPRDFPLPRRRQLPAAQPGGGAVKKFSDACERNRDPILAVLRRVFADRTAVLEIGSGTGQHAAYFAPALPHLDWQPSDVAENLPSVRVWREEAQTPRLLEPIELDVERPFPALRVDAVFTANTLHIVSWPQVERMLAAIGELLPAAGTFAVYGPFNYGGKYTAPSNEAFDAWLRGRDPKSGLRDIEAIVALAERHRLVLKEDNAMPANNRLLVFRKSHG